MIVKTTTGVIFLHDTNGSGSAADFSHLEKAADRIGGVITFPPLNGKKLDAEEWAIEFRRLGIEKLVLAGQRPGLHKPFFSRVLNMAGKDPVNVALAGFESGVHDPEKEKLLNNARLISAIRGSSMDEVMRGSDHRVNENTLVIGGGIAGIQSALEIAEAGRKVFLLEKSPTLGGHMAMFDKTFPTLDCAACILTPKMVEVGQHPNIEMLTYSELESLEGEPGNFTARILKKARRVDLAKCIGCGTCAEKCPSKAPSEFDAFTSMRKAMYIPFPQAVPNKYLIDAAYCTYVENGKCGICVKVCPVDDCINLDQKDETVEINIGNIIVATGFKTFDPSPLEQYAYGKYPNVITSLELERLVNASGPTGGNITFRTRDKKGNWVFDPGTQDKHPESFALIHCIGSRDENSNKYCSRVCCMYSLKLAHLLKEKFPDAPVYEFFIDMRAFGKGYEEFYQRIKGEGVHMIRGKTARIEQDGEKLVLRSEDILADRLIETRVDMVVLSVGLEPGDGASELARMLKIKSDSYGWFEEKDINYDQVSSSQPGIYLAGVCQGPKDIPDAVAQASSAASSVLKNILKDNIEGGVEELTANDIEKRINELILNE
ncbi:MAG: CoB--CoM heterodisulfide reductase iron-sulfur subunit A family protein [Marinilabiliaceae bacterium]|jgi:heterodisulfide reductase subunit A|nr:CoB--CoM heterodisulfide reductase iron-sulfur subunit A family protein [Marinilabiliaceae bacterium]